MAQKKKRKPGRPTESPTGPKRVALSMRTTQTVRDRLEAARIDSGRSLAQEVEYRLERSFLEEERYRALVGEDGGELARLFAAAIRTASIVQIPGARKSKESFLTVPENYALVEYAIRYILELMRPGELHESVHASMESIGRKIGKMHFDARSEMVAKHLGALLQRQGK